MINNLDDKFSTLLLAWYDQHGRNDLPWQNPRTAYRVWISEIMLQQTQVKTVIPYFNSFLKRFSEIEDLAQANEDEVMASWSGLGYYSRARNLHKTAKIIYYDFHGVFPSEPEILVTLPGIGRSTAAAIASQAFNRQSAILDGNVKRVLSRYFMIEGWPEKSSVKARFWQAAENCMPDFRCADYTQAIMDLGATCCTNRNPQCLNCPLQKTCMAYLNERVQDFPEKNPRKLIPTRKQQFLLIRRENREIYLEKNPPTGLWGSLWTLPIIDSTMNASDFILENYGFSVKNIQNLSSFKHTFSHFHLIIHPVLIEVTTNNSTLLRETPGKWFSIQSLDNLGLAKPVISIINNGLVII